MLGRARIFYNLITASCPPAAKKVIATKAGLTLAGSIMCGLTMRSNIDFLSASITGVMTGSPSAPFQNRRGMAIFIASFLATSIINHYRKTLAPDIEILTAQFVDSTIASNQKALTLCRDHDHNWITNPKQIKEAYNSFIEYSESCISIATTILAEGVLWYFTSGSKEKVGAVFSSAIDIIGLNRIVSIASYACFAAVAFATYKAMLEEAKSPTTNEACLHAFNNRLLTDDLAYLGILNSISGIQERLFKAFWTQHQKKSTSPNTRLLKVANMVETLLKQSEVLLTLALGMYMGCDVFMNALIRSTSILPSMTTLSSERDVPKVICAIQTIIGFKFALGFSNGTRYQNMSSASTAANLGGYISRFGGINLGKTENAGLTIEYGKVTLIQGVSGCGKSTLGKIFADLACPENTVPALDSSLKAPGMIQYITSREIAPVTEMTVREFLTSEAQCSDEELKAILAKVNLAQLDLKKCVPNSLSNGEGKKLLLAKAMAQKARLIVLDETLASFSSKSTAGKSERDIIMQVVKQYAKENNCAVIIISHETDLEKYADSVIAFEEKQIKQTAKSCNSL